MLKILPLILIAAVSMAYASPPDAASVADKETLQAFLEEAKAFIESEGTKPTKG